MKTLVQNPKSEIRSPKEIRKPSVFARLRRDKKSEGAQCESEDCSDFGLRSSFGFRTCLFGFSVLFFAISTACLSTAFAQGTAFTYQGQLQNDGSLANGTFNLQFLLYTNSSGGTAVAGPVFTNGVVVTNGLFTVTMDFGSSVWNGATNWLQIGVETNGGGSFITLSPRQELTPTPYAITAENLDGTVGSSDLSGTYGGVLNLNNPADQFTGSFAGNGAGLTNVNAAFLGGLAAGGFWQLGGNNVGSGQFLGSTNNTPVEIHVNGQRALRLEPSTNGAPNVIGGAAANHVSNSVAGATIGGGGAIGYFGSNYTNTVSADFGTVSGGQNNTAGGFGASVAGGSANSATGPLATIGGGDFNNATAIYAAVAGGSANTAGNSAATVGGGQGNNANAPDAVVSGGSGNSASGTNSTVAGGTLNTASGIGAFVGGGGYDGVSYSGNLATGRASVIGGGLNNTISNLADYAFIGSGYGNLIESSSSQSVIVGGTNNTIQSGSPGSFIGGGRQNLIQTNAGFSTVGGGYLNYIETFANNSVIGGGSGNTIEVDANYSTISGGANHQLFAALSTIGGGDANEIESNATYSFVGGGFLNVINTDSSYSVIGGGNQNTISPSCAGSAIGGGAFDEINNSSFSSCISGGGYNIITENSYSAFIGGGTNNLITDNAPFGTIGGGGENVVSNADFGTVGGGFGNEATAYIATVGGGEGNIASGAYAAIAGGYANVAAGFASFAAGEQAQALHDHSFIWSDNETGAAYSTDRADQFKIQAGGGVQMDVSGSSGLNPAALRVNSSSGNGVGLFVTQSSSSDATAVFTAAGSGDIIKGFNSSNLVFEVVNNGTVYSQGFALTSDRNAKNNFSPVSPTEILDKVTSLPLNEWTYKTDAATKHIGPVAQDFHAAFGLNGEDDKHISVVDEGGVALAAIQGLNQKLEEKDAEIADLKARLEKLEQLINSKNGDQQ